MRTYWKSFWKWQKETCFVSSATNIPQDPWLRSGTHRPRGSSSIFVEQSCLKEQISRMGVGMIWSGKQWKYQGQVHRNLSHRRSRSNIAAARLPRTGWKRSSIKLLTNSGTPTRVPNVLAPDGLQTSGPISMTPSGHTPARFQTRVLPSCWMPAMPSNRLANML